MSNDSDTRDAIAMYAIAIITAKLQCIHAEQEVQTKILFSMAGVELPPEFMKEHILPSMEKRDKIVEASSKASENAARHIQALTEDEEV